MGRVCLTTIISVLPGARSRAPEDGGTRVTVEADYDVHLPVLCKLAESFVLKANEQETELLLANLKARMEA